jgi:hypothetical protein
MPFRQLLTVFTEYVPVFPTVDSNHKVEPAHDPPVPVMKKPLKSPESDTTTGYVKVIARESGVDG